MAQSRMCVGLGLAVLIIAVGGAWAQGSEGATDLTKIERGVAELNRSVGELVDILREYVQAHHVELVMKQIELKNRKLGPIQSELRDARANMSNLEEEKTQLEAQAASLDEETEADLGMEAARLEQIKRELEINKKMVTDRIWELNQRILDLGNDLAREREQVDALERMIDENLDPSVSDHARPINSRP